MQIPCVYIPGPAPAVSVANSTVQEYDEYGRILLYLSLDQKLILLQ
jgi:hypothetical protein